MNFCVWVLFVYTLTAVYSFSALVKLCNFNSSVAFRTRHRVKYIIGVKHCSPKRNKLNFPKVLIVILAKSFMLYGTTYVPIKKNAGDLFKINKVQIARK